MASPRRVVTESLPHHSNPQAVIRMFATCIPGLAPLVSDELATLPGVTVNGTGFDGRADLILFSVAYERWKNVLSLSTAEDVFVEVGRTLRSEGNDPRWIAGRIWKSTRANRALSVWVHTGRRLTSSITFRVIARVLEERSFMRTELRRTLQQTIRKDKPNWRTADPAQIEAWISEYQRGKFITGLRLSDIGMRQHDGRQVERHGALRPTVAAAMLVLAGNPSGRLLDPCCGSGTILAEASRKGWMAEGYDIDPKAVEAARGNVPAATVSTGDARHIKLPDAAVEACVSNLPFGQKYKVQGDPKEWLRIVLSELARITTRGGTIVLLTPDIPSIAIPSELRANAHYQIKLLGRKSTIWSFRREKRQLLQR
jgi:23S rRNA G2445 N2-methylase RlmL